MGGDAALIGANEAARGGEKVGRRSLAA